MEKLPLIKNFEVNVAKAKGRNWNNTAPQYYHYTRVLTPNSDHGHLIALMAQLRIAFPSPDYQLTITGIPVEMMYGIDESKLVDGNIGYPA